MLYKPLVLCLQVFRLASTASIGLTSEASEGQRVSLINVPDYYEKLFTSYPEIQLRTRGAVELIHFFTKSQKELLLMLPKLKKRIVQNGMIWVSWPKKSSKVETDIIEDTIRNYAIEIGLVDVKVCAVDEIWSGLKLVILLKFRKT